MSICDDFVSAVSKVDHVWLVASALSKRGKARAQRSDAKCARTSCDTNTNLTRCQHSCLSICSETRCRGRSTIATVKWCLGNLPPLPSPSHKARKNSSTFLRRTQLLSRTKFSKMTSNCYSHQQRVLTRQCDVMHSPRCPMRFYGRQITPSDHDIGADHFMHRL